jgi:hypothetical protein
MILVACGCRRRPDFGFPAEVYSHKPICPILTAFRQCSRLALRCYILG